MLRSKKPITTAWRAHGVRFVRYRIPEGGSLLIPSVGVPPEASPSCVLGEVDAWPLERAMRRERRLRRRRRRRGLLDS